MPFAPDVEQQSLNILFVTPGYAPAWALGGVVTSMDLLAQALVSLGHQVTVYTTNSDGMGGTLEVPVAHPVSNNGVSVFYFPPSFRINRLFDSRHLINKMRNTIEEFDIVYIAATFQWIGIETANIARSYGIPAIMFSAGTFNRRRFKSKFLKKYIWYFLFLKKTIDMCSALHLVGRYEQKQSMDFVKRWPHFMAPHCIDLARYDLDPSVRFQIRQRYKIDESTPLILAAGRFDRIKRIDILIRSLSQLKDQHDFCLLIAGNAEAEFATELCKLSNSLDISERIIWAGLIPYEDMPKLYAAGDLFVHLSVDENFAMVVAEALAAGLPVLVTPGVGIWQEIRNESVGRCVSLDVDNVSNALVDFFNHRDQWANYGRNAITVAQQRFSPASVGSLMARAFQDVIENTYSAECLWYVPNKGRT